MRRNGVIWRPDLRSYETRKQLRCRSQPYYVLIEYGRHLGLQRMPKSSYWVARVRTKAGIYSRRRLGIALLNSRDRSKGALTYDEALERAKDWFKLPEVISIAADARPIGSCQDLHFSPIGEVFTIGEALRDYVEWKRIAAARSHFETLVSRINFHIVPRLANLPAAEFNGEIFRRFVREVLETPPKRGGNQQVGPRRSIESLTDDELRKRKKLVNTLTGHLRGALLAAWENGKFDNERAWRCLKSLRVVDRPRILHLSRAECRRLLAACRPDLARLVLGALYTGCRISELIRMRCSDVGRDGYGVYIEPLKTFRPRFVFLPDEGMAWFLQITKGRAPNESVFMRDNGKPWFGNQKGLFKEAVRQAGLPDAFCFHGLRHTYASQLVQAGATVFAVAEQLGHVEPTTVLRTYGHLSPQIRESEVRQRFSTVSKENEELARKRERQLRAWRRSIHGKSWRTYAKIEDVDSRRGDPELYFAGEAKPRLKLKGWRPR